MPAAAVYTASLPTEIRTPPTPQSPMPRICSASVATTRSTSSAPSFSASNAGRISAGRSMHRNTPRGQRYSWLYRLIAWLTVGS